MCFNTLHGQLAVVTGAGGGIGEAITRWLLRYGLTVAAIDNNKENLDSLNSRMASLGYDKVKTYICDVANNARVQYCIESIENDLGVIGILVNAAGTLVTNDIVQSSPEEWETVFHTNTLGVLNCITAVGTRMVQRRTGNIVTVASNGTHMPRAKMGIYSASKAAAAMITKTAGLELSQHGIRCNVVSPGSTNTKMQTDYWEQAGISREQVIEGDGRFRLGIPLGCLANPDDIAQSVLFLVSEMSKHITMAELCVDGGATLGV